MPTHNSESYTARTHHDPDVPLQNQHSANDTLLISAAQYVRMSDEAQQYSVDNQKDAIAQYASLHGFKIVKTYADLGKSGVVAKNRTGLRELLKDVVSGEAQYKVVLVYDVSRWGRFPNNDEAAHYEYLCASSGIPLHYCAELFVNDGTASNSLLKALKRSMAAEFSRELGEKVFRGKTRLVQMGFWVGGKPGYGLRRLMLSGDGKRKQVMKPGEQKNLTTDRVVLIPGPRKEVKVVRQIFTLAALGNGPSAIARLLNEQGITRYGKLWIHATVRDMVTNPKYMGCNTWNRRTQRLHGPISSVDPQFWVRKPHSFSALVDEELFNNAHAGLPVRKIWSEEEILRRLKRLLKREGRLSESLILKARGMPSTVTIHNYFGTYRELYNRLGYRVGAQYIHKSDQAERTLHLRETLANKLRELFPEHVATTQLPRKNRTLLWIDDSFAVSLVLCASKWKRGKFIWTVYPNPAERNFITLLCAMDASHDHIVKYFMLPRMGRFKPSCEHDSWFRQGTRIRHLSEFYSVALKLWIGHATQGQEESS
jgi:DNA invertase Pin-like site-specific DNA recombinase